MDLRSTESAGAVPAEAPRLAGLLALGLVVGVINGLNRVAMPLYVASLGGDPWQVGLVGGLGYAGILLLSLPTGAWIDRHGSRPLFMRGALAASLLYLLLPLVRTPGQAILLSALLGLLLPLRTIPVHTEFLALLPQLSAARAGWNRAAHTMGMFFLGPAVAAAVIAAFGFAPVFVLAACALLAAQPLGWRALAVATGGVAGHASDQSLAERVRAQLSLLRRHPDVRRTMGMDFLAQMTTAYFVVFVLILAVRRFGMPLQAAAGLVTLQGALFVAVLFAGAALVLRWKEDVRYLLAFALLLAQALLCGLGTGPMALWIGAALSGVGLGLQGLTSTARYGALMSRYGRGRIGGLTSLGPTSGGVIGAMLGGLVSQRLGTEAGFLMLGAACALMCVAQVLRLRNDRGPSSRA